MGPIVSLMRRLPWYLQGPIGGRFKASFLFALELQVQTFREAILASRPTQCEPDALPHLARDRGITLFATEPEASQRQRLTQWRRLHQGRGRPFGVLKHLQPYFLPGAIPLLRIVSTSGGGLTTWWTLHPDGSTTVYRAPSTNWNWDGHFSAYARYWVIVYLPGTTLDGDPGWGGSTWSGSRWGGTPTAAQIADIVAIIEEWGTPAATLWGVVFARDPASFDPTSTAVGLPNGSTTLPNGSWGQGTDPATGKPTRLDTAAYVYDLGEA